MKNVVESKALLSSNIFHTNPLNFPKIQTYCWFSVLRHLKYIKIKIKNRSIAGLSRESEKRKKVTMQRLSPRFRSQQFVFMQDMRRGFPPKFI